MLQTVPFQDQIARVLQQRAFIRCKNRWLALNDAKNSATVLGYKSMNLNTVKRMSL